MAKPVSQQVVVVTGASSGVGRATARAFGARGAKVGLIARNEQALQNCAREIEQAGGEALVLPADVSRDAEVLKAATAAFERWGRIDTWVNNAMVTVFSRVVEIRPDEFRRVTEVNYLGYVYGTLAALRFMTQCNEGTILQIGSALAYRSIPLQSAYCATKAAIRGFSDSLRSELIHDGSNIRVAMLQLPAVNTPQGTAARNRMPRHAQPVPPLFEPEVIAKAVLYASEHPPMREMWIGHTTAEAVVGQKFLGRFLDWYMARKCWDAQMDPRPNDLDKPDNLFAPYPEDLGAHGDHEPAKTFSGELWARMNAGKLAAGFGAAAAVALLAARALRA
jgi:NADP-dependent 3-hydroxy acid dehydrogenase YdfG